MLFKLDFQPKVTLLVLAVLCLANTAALAAGSSVIKKPTSSFDTQLSSTYSTNLINFEDGSKSEDLSHRARLRYNFENKSSVSVSIGYAQNIKNSEDNDISDLSLGYALPALKLKWFSSTDVSNSYSFSAVVPLSKNSTKKDQLQTSLSASTGLGFDFKNSFSMSLGLSLGQNFHSYSEDINGSVLNKYASNQSLGFGYTWKDFDFSLSFANKTRVSYYNSVKSSFEIAEEVNYKINKIFKIAVGHTNSGSTLKSNGIDSNIDFYNENNSVIYSTIGAKF